MSLNETLHITRRERCGHFEFIAAVPQIGTSQDQKQWFARVAGDSVPGSYSSLKEAMRAALDFNPRAER